MTLLQGGKSGYAARQDFPGIRHVAREDLDIGTGKLHRVLVALFLGCHKREKQGIKNTHGKKKDGFFWPVTSCCPGLFGLEFDGSICQRPALSNR